MRRRRSSRLSLFYGVLVTALLVGGSLWLDRRGQTAAATVTGKTEEIRLTHEPQGGWYRYYRVGATFDNGGAPAAATVTVEQGRYDSLRLGDSLAIRYLPSMPLFARTADRSTATLAAEMLRQLASSNLIAWAVIGVLAMVIAANIGMVLSVGTGLVWLAVGYAWLLRSPSTPVPSGGTEAPARVSAVTLVAKSPARKAARRRGRAFRSDAVRRLAMPYQVVQLQVPLPGLADSMLAVDAVDSGSVAGLTVGAVLPVRYPAGDARSARLTAGTRTFTERNRYHYRPIVVGLPLLGMLGAYGFRRRRNRAGNLRGDEQ